MGVLLVSDTSVLIDLRRADLLDALFALPFTLAVPDLLYERELKNWDGPSLKEKGLAILTLEAEGVTLAQRYRSADLRLSLPDAFALALAVTGGHVLLAGDAALRTLASAERIANAIPDRARSDRSNRAACAMDRRSIARPAPRAARSHDLLRRGKPPAGCHFVRRALSRRATPPVLRQRDPRAGAGGRTRGRSPESARQARRTALLLPSRRLSGDPPRRVHACGSRSRCLRRRRRCRPVQEPRFRQPVWRARDPSFPDRRWRQSFIDRRDHAN